MTSSKGSDATPGPARRPSLIKGPRVAPADEPPIAPGGPPPRQVVVAAIALLVAAVFAIVAAVALYGQRHWLTNLVKKQQRNDKPKDKLTGQALYDHVSAVMRSQVVSAVVLGVILLMIAFFAVKGRPWARWAVIGVWLIGTFTGQGASFGSVLEIGGSYPGVYKIASFVAGLGMIVAVVLVNVRPSARFFTANRAPRPGRGGLANASRPGSPNGQVPARPSLRDMFAPRTRPAPTARNAAPSPNAATSTNSSNRAKAKVRADADAVAKGAELARNRAKTSKSRRTDA